jgi:hypothetical protein
MDVLRVTFILPHLDSNGLQKVIRNLTICLAFPSAITFLGTLSPYEILQLIKEMKDLLFIPMN